MGYRAQSVTTPRGCAKEGYPSLTTLHPSRPKVQTQPVSFALNSLRSVGICYVAAKEAWPKTSARANLLRLLLLSRPEIIPGSTALGGMERCRQHRPSWFSKLGSSIVLRHESTALLYGYWNYSKYGINSALLEKRFFPKHMGPKTRKNVFAKHMAPDTRLYRLTAKILSRLALYAALHAREAASCASAPTRPGAARHESPRMFAGGAPLRR